MATNQAFHQFRDGNALEVELVERPAGGGEQPGPDPGWEAAVDDNGREVDDRDGRHDSLGKRRATVVDPDVERFAEVDPVVSRVPERPRVDAAFAQQIFEHED
ncbi:hypothetical protein D9M72_478350 [compost metagenome]